MLRMFKKLIFIAVIWQSLASLAYAQVGSEPNNWMPLGLPPHIEAEARKAGSSYEKIHNFLKKNFHKLVDNVGHLTIESEEFGIDHLIVAKLVFGIERKVEKNPWPTGEDDQFLLKDELTIGYRLGAGLVVLGDMGYVKKYTLVQPVATHRDGMLANDFIVNLMLPFQVNSQNLPPRYVLMTEGYIEGRGRLKLGGGIMLNPFVHQTHHSRVTLSRTFIDNRRPDLMRVFVDDSEMKEWGQLLYITNGFLSYSLFKAALQKGQTARSFYEVQKNLPEFNEILYRLSVHNDFSILDDFAIERRVEDRFRQSTADISIFGLYSSQSRNRFDVIDEYITDTNGEMMLVNQQFQHENERERSWFTFLSGEEYFSNILFMAYDDQGQLGRPHAIITTRMNDKKANIKELKDKYIDSINRMALQTNTVELSPETYQMVKDHKPRATIDVRITIDDFAIDFLQNISEEQFWNHIYKVTKIDEERWEQALEYNQVRGSAIRNRDELRPLALKLRSMGRKFKKLKQCEDNRCRIKEVTRIIRSGVYVSGGRFAPELIAVLHSLVPGHIGIETSIGLVKDGRIVDAMSWDNGVKIEVPQKYYRFNFQRATEIYHLFDQAS